MTEQVTEAEANEMQRKEMARQSNRLAAELRNAADRIERYALQFTSQPGREAAAVAADVLNEYEQINVGPIVWAIVRELSRTT